MSASDVQPHYYLVPYNLHLTDGQTSAAPLQIVDQDGMTVSGTLSFTVDGPQGLVSVDASGYVTAHRNENPDSEAGAWISATLDGEPVVANTCVVRVLPENYGLSFLEAAGPLTALYYPEVVEDLDTEALVARFEIPAVNEYACQIESRLMAASPFFGARQVFEVDFGVAENNRVCGVSGNPVRLGWNIEGNEWQNCFLVPFAPFSVPNPQWFVFYHELGHNLIWASPIFAAALNAVEYSEGLASAISLAAMAEVVTDPSQYPLGSDAVLSLQTRHDDQANALTAAFGSWLTAGAPFCALNADVVDGIWLHHANDAPHFAERFFLPLQPLMIESLGAVLCETETAGANGKHTFFAALVSSAAGTELRDEFTDTYHYPLVDPLYTSARTAFAALIAQRECPGDFDRDGSCDAADAQVLANHFGRSDCSGDCAGALGDDGDIDGSDIAAFLQKYGRSDCL